MENTKRAIILLLCVIFAFSPLMTLGTFSYADNGAGGGSWTACNPNDKKTLVAGMKAYLRSRNFNYYKQFADSIPAGDILKGYVNWDYSTLKRIGNKVGIDIDTLNAHLWYSLQENQSAKFFFDYTGISTLNNLYAAILNEYNINSPNTNVNLGNGEFFIDDDNNTCFVYIVNAQSGNTESNNYYDRLIMSGTTYLYSQGNDLFSRFTQNEQLTINYNNNSINYYMCTYNQSHIQKYLINNTSISSGGSAAVFAESYPLDSEPYNRIIDGNVGIFRNGNALYLGTWIHYKKRDRENDDYKFQYNTSLRLDNFDNSALLAMQAIAKQGAEAAALAVGKSAIVDVGKLGLTGIDDFIADQDDPEVDVTPIDGDDLPEVPNDPVNPSPNNPNNTGLTINPDGGFNFQMPELNVDWHLNLDTNNLPFPFSIPYDMIHFFNAFSAEPIAPHIQENVSIANITIPIDIDLDWLDDVAGYFRTFVLLIYVFGLIIATRALFHIY